MRSLLSTSRVDQFVIEDCVIQKRYVPKLLAGVALPKWTWHSGKTPYPYDTTPMEKMRDDGFVLVGTPDRVYQDLMAQYEEYGGFGTFMAIVRMGAMPQELVLRNVSLFGKEVIPRLHALKAKAA